MVNEENVNSGEIYINLDLGSSAEDIGFKEDEGRAFCEDAKGLIKELNIAREGLRSCLKMMDTFKKNSMEFKDCLADARDYAGQLVNLKALINDSDDYLNYLRTGELNGN